MPPNGKVTLGNAPARVPAFGGGPFMINPPALEATRINTGHDWVVVRPTVITLGSITANGSKAVTIIGVVIERSALFDTKTKVCGMSNNEADNQAIKASLGSTSKAAWKRMCLGDPATRDPKIFELLPPSLVVELPAPNVGDVIKLKKFVKSTDVPHGCLRGFAGVQIKITGIYADTWKDEQWFGFFGMEPKGARLTSPDDIVLAFREESTKIVENNGDPYVQLMAIRVGGRSDTATIVGPPRVSGMGEGKKLVCKVNVCVAVGCPPEYAGREECFLAGVHIPEDVIAATFGDMTPHRHMAAAYVALQCFGGGAKHHVCDDGTGKFAPMVKKVGQNDLYKDSKFGPFGEITTNALMGVFSLGELHLDPAVIGMVGIPLPIGVIDGSEPELAKLGLSMQQFLQLTAAISLITDAPPLRCTGPVCFGGGVAHYFVDNTAAVRHYLANSGACEGFDVRAIYAPATEEKFEGGPPPTFEVLLSPPPLEVECPLVRSRLLAEDGERVSYAKIVRFAGIANESDDTAAVEARAVLDEVRKVSRFLIPVDPRNTACVLIISVPMATK